LNSQISRRVHRLGDLSELAHSRARRGQVVHREQDLDERTEREPGCGFRPSSCA
jgi:hypothetical protein